MLFLEEGVYGMGVGFILIIGFFYIRLWEELRDMGVLSLRFL